jgi:hypothetical protein
VNRRHYCTYFDSGFLPQGIALWKSLKAHDASAVLWVLALDEVAASVMRGLDAADLRVVELTELEAADSDLLVAKGNRRRVEYYFTLSPCWPRYLFRTWPEIDRLLYLDADLFLFADPRPVWDDLERGSVLLCSHRLARFLHRYERHGRFNVGVLGWKRNSAGLACLDWWRERCLEWCYDRIEEKRYADQKYLEDWPLLFSGVVECKHPGVNLAPWNWMNHRYEFATQGVRVDGLPVVVFHFARFRALRGDWWWQSGQLDFGVMPWGLRQALYCKYWRALASAADEIRKLNPIWAPSRRPARLDGAFWRLLPFRLLFGSDWLRVGGVFVSGRLGLGRFSGGAIESVRKWVSKRRD